MHMRFRRTGAFSFLIVRGSTGGGGGGRGWGRGQAWTARCALRTDRQERAVAVAEGYCGLLGRWLEVPVTNIRGRRRGQGHVGMPSTVHLAVPTVAYTSSDFDFACANLTPARSQRGADECSKVSVQPPRARARVCIRAPGGFDSTRHGARRSRYIYGSCFAGPGRSSVRPRVVPRRDDFLFSSSSWSSWSSWDRALSSCARRSSLCPLRLVLGRVRDRAFVRACVRACWGFIEAGASGGYAYIDELALCCPDTRLK
ncbi:hypothetical protein BC628DRAFT_214089 [Trametes gibbosa]|nr:hypothetical protein BC628DRAFT_214089 [Trametes gibbosa]